jgi:dTDP-4-amino-4,6-dideoxy-D-galactose acyltransferase
MSDSDGDDGELCDRLEWDSTFFGVPIARIRANRLCESLATRIEAWAEAQGIRCLYFLADLDDIPTVRLAEQRGYRLVDVKVTYEVGLAALTRVIPKSQLPQPLQPPVMRIAVAEDVPALRAIALKSYRGTRFYNDPDFPDAQCDELYATWIERSVHGWADRVFALGPLGAPYGYITCHRDGRMGLSGVRADMRGRGYGLALYQAAFDWFTSERVEPIRLITQGANVRAQRLFQQFGGRITGIALWYHRWLPTHP